MRGSERSQESRSREEKGNSFRFLSFAIPPFSFHFPPLLQNLMGGSKEGKVTWLSSPTGSAFISFTLSLTLKTRSIRPAANNFFFNLLLEQISWKCVASLILSIYIQPQESRRSFVIALVFRNSIMYLLVLFEATNYQILLMHININILITVWALEHDSLAAR